MYKKMLNLIESIYTITDGKCDVCVYKFNPDEGEYDFESRSDQIVDVYRASSHDDGILGLENADILIKRIDRLDFNYMNRTSKLCIYYK